MRNSLLVLCLFLAACGGAAASGGGAVEPNAGTGIVGAGPLEPPRVDAAGNPPNCPPRYGLAAPGCDDGTAPASCGYPEGSCSCRRPTYCGGMARPASPAVWTCEAPVVPCPAAGTPCTTTPVCGRPSCDSEIVCEGGVIQIRMMPPPP